jgi:hypothetical protein
MSGVRPGARSVLKWFSALYLVLIVVQVFLAGEGIFGLNNIKHDCTKTKIANECIGNSKTLDPHRALGFFLTVPGALLFLIVALLAWPTDRRVRRVSIALPFVLFIQMILPWFGRWGGAFHPLLAFVILGMFGWLFAQLRGQRTAAAAAA